MSISSRWESSKPASDLRSLWETLGAYQSKVISLVDNIFGIRRKIEEDDFLTISCFTDEGRYVKRKVGLLRWGYLASHLLLGAGRQ